jgi:hypothetical protein
MGMLWVTGVELSEAIPPAYARFVAEAFLNIRERERAERDQLRRLLQRAR